MAGFPSGLGNAGASTYDVATSILYGTGLAAEWVSPAAAEGFFHTFSGWLVFVVAFAGLLIVQQGLARIRFSPRPALTQEVA